MINMKLSQAAAAIQGTLLGQEQTFNGISIDSRSDCTGTLFVALKGPNFNAEKFCQQAIDNGAIAVMVTQDTGIKAPQIVCNDSQQALTALSKNWAKNCQAKIITITGSNGKTTVKNMLSSILSLTHRCHATQGNFNNEIGVPLTLCGINAEDEFAVVEMGAAKLGDIQHLISLVDATTTILTNASAAHIGRFGSLDNIIKEKGRICSELNSGQHSILPIDDDNYHYWRKSTAAKVSTFGNHIDADIRVKNDEQFDLITPSTTIANIRLPVAGLHNKINAACACAAALTLKIDHQQIKQGLEQFVPEKGRLQNMGQINGNLLIDDSYNANEASVKAAIDVLSQYQGTKTLIFGDMAELGHDSSSLHRAVGAYCQQRQITHLLTIGQDSKHSSDAFSGETKHFSNIVALKSHLTEHWHQFGTILVKGSRSMRLENLISALINEEKTA